ncbi:MAG: tripartite tricarboxylate transporter substrate binding protein [Cloacibacillus porcorum]|uniref:tripartite tricarboxylate transporter substrate binding protein n=1 Tax=Cloacibacillus porcorum TaxID=1197717 RepID=UPI0023F3FDA3|nr:tripartite tricarboxylate transporter substrate binding protein [Cloacibacillus porcorum]MCD7877759.1 tripartite tricarboxylate transporter substrate binding protein [Cloacibacillus porcorum]
MFKKFAAVCFVVLSVFAFTGLPACAADKYPSKPIKMVVGYAPGGGVDTTARIFAKYAEEFLGQPVVITNVAGGGGSIGAREVLKARPDGYTLLWMHEAILSGYITGVAKFSWEEFTPLGKAVATCDAIVVKADSPWKTIDEFMAYLKDNPGKVKMPVEIGSMSQLELAAIDNAAGGKRIVAVSGGGGSTRIPKLLGGFLDAASLNAPSIPQYVKDGSLRPLAVCTPERSPFFPELPTLMERGYDVNKPFNMYVFGPNGLPKDVVERVSRALKKFSEDERVKKDLAAILAAPSFMTPDEQAKYLTDLTVYLQGVAKKAGINQK